MQSTVFGNTYYQIYSNSEKNGTIQIYGWFDCSWGHFVNLPFMGQNPSTPTGIKYGNYSSSLSNGWNNVTGFEIPDGFHGDIEKPPVNSFFIFNTVSLVIIIVLLPQIIAYQLLKKIKASYNNT